MVPPTRIELVSIGYEPIALTIKLWWNVCGELNFPLTSFNISHELADIPQ